MDDFDFWSLYYKLENASLFIREIIDRQGNVSYTFSDGSVEKFPSYSAEAITALNLFRRECVELAKKCRVVGKFIEGDIGEDGLNVITQTDKTSEEKV